MIPEFRSACRALDEWNSDQQSRIFQTQARYQRTRTLLWFTPRCAGIAVATVGKHTMWKRTNHDDKITPAGALERFNEKIRIEIAACRDAHVHPKLIARALSAALQGIEFQMAQAFR
jgi:hypothetical protein